MDGLSFTNPYMTPYNFTQVAEAFMGNQCIAYDLEPCIDYFPGATSVKFSEPFFQIEGAMGFLFKRFPESIQKMIEDVARYMDYNQVITAVWTPILPEEDKVTCATMKWQIKRHVRLESMEEAKRILT